MVIRFLKSNNASAFFILPFIALLIWVFSFFMHTSLEVKHAMPLYELLATPVAGTSWLTKILALLLIVAQGFLLNYIVNENDALTKKSSLPALFYIVFQSNNSSMLEMHPLLFSNLFLLFALSKLLNSYRKDVAFSQVFDAGLLLSIASLFYFPCVVFFPMLGVALILFRPFQWREWIISFFGVLVPYIFVFTFYFWNEKMDYLLMDKMFYPVLFKRPLTAIPQSFYFLLSLGCIIFLLAIGKLFNGLGGGAQKTKKALVLMIWWVCFALLSLLLAPEISSKYFSLLSIPAAVICSNYFLRMKREFWGEMLFLVFLIALFVNLVVNIF
ncbi:MAG: beta-carotene 15,15-monooxygenase [Bacteroidota bacterium]|jgi:hypothetical protein|nr:beta-carotene 15,15-monooxygenase [Bacteroidota bacterium]